MVSQDVKEPVVERITALIYSYFFPSKILLFRSSQEDDPIVSLAPWTKEYSLIAGKAAIYVCENRVCSLPAADLEKLKEILGK